MKTNNIIIIVAILYEFIMIDINGQKFNQNNHSVTFERENTVLKENVKIDFVTGLPKAIYNVNYKSSYNDPEKIARQYLIENSNSFKMSNNLHEIITHKIQESQGGYHVRFYQTNNNIPVYASEVVININRQNVITMVMSDYHPNIILENVTPSISANDALEIGKNHFDYKGDNLKFFKAELYVFRFNDKYYLAYKVNMYLNKPHGDWQLFIDAITGQILKVENLEKNSNGQGMIFKPDPLTRALANYGDTGFTDSNDQNSTQLQNQRELVTLLDINFNGSVYKLEGPYVKIIDIEPPNITPVESSDGILVLTEIIMALKMSWYIIT